MRCWLGAQSTSNNEKLKKAWRDILETVFHPISCANLATHRPRHRYLSVQFSSCINSISPGWEEQCLCTMLLLAGVSEGVFCNFPGWAWYYRVGERERIPTHLSFQGGLKNGKCINRILISHVTVFRKYWKVEKFSQQGGIRTKTNPSQNCMIKRYSPRCHHLFCVMGNNLDVITLQNS